MTLSPAQTAAYAQHRAKGYNASSAFRYARQAPLALPPLPEGWEVDIQIVQDEDDPDLSWLGTFAKEPSRDALAIPKGYRHSTGAHHFLPANPAREVRPVLRSMGYGKHEAHLVARRQEREDMLKFLEYGRTWGYYGVRVRLLVEGDEVGEESIWQCDGDEEYLRSEGMAMALGLVEAAKEDLFGHAPDGEEYAPA